MASKSWYPAHSNTYHERKAPSPPRVAGIIKWHQTPVGNAPRVLVDIICDAWDTKVQTQEFKTGGPSDHAAAGGGFAISFGRHKGQAKPDEGMGYQTDKKQR